MTSPDIARVADRITRVLDRHGGRASRREITRAIASRYRHNVGPALEQLTRTDLLDAIPVSWHFQLRSDDRRSTEGNPATTRNDEPHHVTNDVQSRTAGTRETPSKTIGPSNGGHAEPR